MTTRILAQISTGELKAILPDGKITVPLRGAAAQALLKKLPVDVAVCPDGSMIQLLDMRPVVD
jgi:hypothetical protein